MIDSDRVEKVQSEEDLREINREIIRLGERFDKRSWRPVMCTLWIRKMKCTAVSLWQEKDSKMQISRHRCICIRQMKC